MASKDTIGSSASDKADWSSAWEAVSRLAATQESLQEAERHGSMSILTQSASEQQERRSASMTGVAPVEHEHLSGAIAEIEKASALLRKSEPSLEIGLPSQPAGAERRAYWSVWILIGTIWISAILVVASAAGAMIYLLN